MATAVTPFVTGECVFNATALGGIDSFNLAVRDTPFRVPADGDPDAGIFAVTESDVRAMIGTYNIKDALTYGVSDGYALTGAGFLAYLRPVAASGIRTAANAFLFTAATGLVVPRGLTAAQGQAARMELELIPYNSSGTIPFTLASSSAALNTPTNNAAWTLGRVDLNGSALAGIQSVSIDYGIAEIVNRGDGVIWPKSAGIESRLPIVTLTGTDVNPGLAILSGGYPVTQIDLYFRKLTLGGGGTDADATTTHIKCAINVAGAHSLSIGSRVAGLSWSVFPYKVSGTATMIFTTDVAIP